MSLARRRVLLVGWDAADWQVINPLMDAGRMPALAGIVEGGTCASLASLSPCLSPMLWTTIATGHFADQHGVLGFAEVSRHGSKVIPVGADSWRVPAMWDVLEGLGRKTAVIGWPVTHPVKGSSLLRVSDKAFDDLAKGMDGWRPMAPGSVHPPELHGFLSDLRVHPCELGRDALIPLIPLIHEVDEGWDARPGWLREIVARQASIQSVASAFMEAQAGEWDFMAVYFDGLDRAGHAFMPYRAPLMAHINPEDAKTYGQVIDEFYVWMDAMLGRLLELAGPDVTVVVVSDHGFKSGATRPAVVTHSLEPVGEAAEWHREYGIMAVRGHGIRKDARIYGATLLDMAPSIMHLLCGPVGRDLPGKVLHDLFETPADVAWMETWGGRVGSEGPVGPPGPVESSGSAESVAMRRLVDLGYLPGSILEDETGAERVEAESCLNLALVYLQKGEPERAAEAIEGAVDRFPRDRRYQTTKAQALQRSGASKRLLDWVQVVRAWAAEDPEVAVYEAAALHGLGESGKAQSMLEDVAMRVPSSELVLSVLVQVHRARGNWDEALRHLSQLEALQPESPIASCERAGIELRCQRLGEAIQAADTSIRLAYWNPLAHLHRGLALAQSGHVLDGIDALETAVRQQPRLGEGHYHLSRLHRMLGNMSKALHHHDRARDLAPPQSATLHPSPGSGSPGMGSTVPKTNPSPSQSVASSRITIVTGIPRSGTSMVMQVLKAGGFPVLHDDFRAADTDNPQGYLEWGPIGHSPDWQARISSAAGRAVKVVLPLATSLPQHHVYDVILVERSLEEVLDSQDAMLRRRGHAVGSNDRANLAATFQGWIESLSAWLRQSPGSRFIILRHADVLTRPKDECQRLVSWLGTDLDVVAMAEAVHPELHRQRRRH